jgi:hypothetical protein
MNCEDLENIEKELRAKVGGILLKKSIVGGGGIITDVGFVSTLNKSSVVGVFEHLILKKIQFLYVRVNNSNSCLSI